MVKSADRETLVLKSEHLADTLRVITEAVPGLRKAGASRVVVGGVDIYIEPLPLEPQKRGKGDDDDADFLDLSKFRKKDDGAGDDGGGVQ